MRHFPPAVADAHRFVRVMLVSLVTFAAAAGHAQQPVENPPLEQSAPQTPDTSAGGRASQPPPSAPSAPAAPPDAPGAPTPEFPPVEAAQPPPVFRNPVLRIGGDYVLGETDDVREVVVISGNARIDGHVQRDVVVVLGNAELASTAVIGGSLVVVGGNASIREGARVAREFVVVAGQVDAPDGFSPGAEHIVIGPELFGRRIDALVPWVTQGLLWGRPIVPQLGWVWSIVALVFLMYLAINFLLNRPVAASARTLANRPVTSFGVGLLVLFLSGPVILLLMVSVAGIVVIPFALCALLLGWVIGKVAVSRSIGASLIGNADGDAPTDRSPSRGRAALAFALGFTVLCIAYVVPILGLLAWTMTGVIGLGASALAFASGYRRENPSVPRRPGAPAPPPRPPDPSFTPVVTADSSGGSHPMPLPAHVPQAASQSDYVAHPGSAAAEPEHIPDRARYAVADAPGVTTAPPLSPRRPAATPEMLVFPRASFKERLAAFVLDVLLIAIGVNLLLVIGDGARTTLLFLLAYHVGFWTWKGTTVGGLICRLRVIRTTGEPLQFGEAFIRGLTGILSLAALGLGGLWILIDEERQAWHDRVAGTYVVKVPRDWPL